MFQDVNAGILRSLEQDSEVLERIREAFERTLTHEDVKAYSFVEEIPTAGVGMVRVLLLIHSFANINKLRPCGKNRWSRNVRGKSETHPRARGIYMPPTKR